MRRIMVFLVSAALVAGALFAVPAAAQEAEAPEIPAVPNIVDDEGDAGQGTSSLGDVLAAWFTESGDKLSVHFHMRRVPAPPASAYGIEYRVYASPEGEDDCFLVRGQITSGTYAGDNAVKVFDACGTGTNWFGDEAGEGELFYGTYPDDTGWVTLTFDKALTGYSSDGSSLVTPRAQIHALTGAQAGAFLTPMLDDTERGTDYAVGAGEPEEDAKETPPGKNDPPGNKKGCKKGKGKKRGCEGKGKKAPKPGKPAKPADSCAPYVPGEMGKDAETTVVTDAATEDKPIEIDVPLGPATGSIGSDRTTRMKHNVQVDSTNGDVGLFARLEGPPLDDPDLYVYWPGGSRAAVAGGFNPLLAAGPLPEAHPILAALNGTGSGGHSEFTAEQIDGLRTSDCQGWTLDLVNWAGRGGYTLKLWLGEVQNEPAAEE